MDFYTNLRPVSCSLNITNNCYQVFLHMVATLREIQWKFSKMFIVG